MNFVLWSHLMPIWKSTTMASYKLHTGEVVHAYFAFRTRMLAWRATKRGKRGCELDPRLWLAQRDRFGTWSNLRGLLSYITISPSFSSNIPFSSSSLSFGRSTTWHLLFLCFFFLFRPLQCFSSTDRSFFGRILTIDYVLECLFILSKRAVVTCKLLFWT